MFQHIAHFRGDPILTLNEQFAGDPHPNKVNLSIGVFLDDDRRLPLMTSVAIAKARMQESSEPHPYLPMEGLRNYRAQSRDLVFGEEISRERGDCIATVQTLGGSGALRIGADFLAGWFPEAHVWVSGPTWDNHWGIFASASFPVKEYPYYSSETKGVDFSALCRALDQMPKGDAVILHGCCHNPTGADLTDEQWCLLAEIFRQRGLIAFFDMAYQGFGRGVDEDAFAARHFVAKGIPVLVANSFSKNFSLYGERCGALHVVCPDARQARNVLSQLQLTVRRSYSSPPTFGSQIVASVLADENLRNLWQEELTRMRERMRTMRDRLYCELVTLNPDQDWEYLLKQQGMFSFTGLSVAQVKALRDQYGVYLIDSGRLCVAALTEAVLPYVAQSLVDVSKLEENGAAC